MSLFAQPTDATTRHLGRLGASGPPTPIDPQLMRPAMGVRLVLVVGVAIALRMLLFTLGPALDMDRAAVDASASAIALGSQWAQTGQGSVSGESVGEMVPIYPALLAGIEMLGLPWHALLVFQILLTSATVLVVYGLIEKLFASPMGAMVGAMVVAVHPVFILNANLMLPAALAGFGLAGGLYLVLPSAERTLKKVALGGLILGASSLVVPWLMLIGPMLALGLALTSLRLRNQLAAGLLLATSMLGPGLWMMHNHAQGLGYHLVGQPYAYALDRATDVQWRAASTPTTRNQVFDHQLAQVHQLAQTRNGDASTAMGIRAGQTLMEYPRQAMNLWMEQALELCTGSSTKAWYTSLGLTYEPVDPLASLRVGDLAMVYQSDPAGAWLTLGQRAINTGLSVAALVAGVLLMWRRRWRVVILLGGLSMYVLIALWFAPVEALRLPLVLIQAVLIASLWTDPPPRKAKVPRPTRKQRIAQSFDQPPSSDLPEEPVPAPTGRPI